MIEKQSNLVKMRLAAVVILYNPDGNLLSNIHSYINDVEFLIVFDNSEKNDAKILLEKETKIRYYWDGANQGIAKRLNQAIEICVQEKIDFLLTMDQDSSFKKGDFSTYLNKINNCNVENAGMYGVIHHPKFFKPSNLEYAINKLLITSGSVLSLNVTEKVGKFNESLFIDMVDTEYCLRLFQQNFKTILFENLILQHEIGEAVKTFTPRLKREERKIHSSKRIYYIVRNFLFLRKHYADQSNHLDYTPILNEIKNGILYGNEKLRFIIEIWRGYADFKNKKMT